MTPQVGGYQTNSPKSSPEYREEFAHGYIARNPKNHADMWYVAKKYFDDNLEPA